MTKPVACAVVFHSVSKARVLSIWMVTTPVAMRSRVWAQVAGLLGIPAADTVAAAAPRVGAGVAKAGMTKKAVRDTNSEVRSMPILGLSFD